MEKPRKEPGADASYYYPEVLASAKACVSWGCSSQFIPRQSHSPERGGRALQRGWASQVCGLLTLDPSVPGSFKKIVLHFSLPQHPQPPDPTLWEPPLLTSPLGRPSGMERGCARTGPVPSSRDAVLLPARPHSQDFPTLSFSLSDAAFGKVVPYLISKETSSQAQVLSNQMSYSSGGSPLCPLPQQRLQGLWVCTAPTLHSKGRHGEATGPGSDVHQTHRGPG